MQTSDKFFLPREEMLRLASGSFEHLTVRVEAAVVGEKTRLFENSDPEILGTFPGYAVVLTSAGKLFRAKYEEADSGAVRIISVEALKAAVYPKAALPTFLRNEAGAAVDLFLRGSVAEANARVARLVNLVDDTRSYDEKDIVASFVERLSVDREWKRTVAARAVEIRSLLGEASTQLGTNNLRAKFFKLYDGSLLGTALEQYRGLVNEDLGSLVEKLDAVYAQTLASLGHLREIAVTFDPKNETMAVFRAFAEDFFSDLRAVKQQLAETVQGVESVGARGKLYDALVEEVLRFELAGAFVVQMTNRLATASV